jgi:hypothetical protein
MEAFDLVHAKLPPEKQYPFVGADFRRFELRSEYKKLFPNGTLLQKAFEVRLLAVGILLGGMFLQLLLNRVWP